jgi:hypothetical protein
MCIASTEGERELLAYAQHLKLVGRHVGDERNLVQGKRCIGKPLNKIHPQRFRN